MELACYYDFTCAYSYRAWTWFERQRAAEAAIDVDWRPFVLKEVNRAETDPSLLSGPAIDSVAVLSLAIAEALRGRPSAEAYRAATFNAMHAYGDRPDRDEVLEIARRAGLDTDAFQEGESRWLEAVRASHEGAVAELGVFGTPTLVFAGGGAAYLKLAALPPDGDGELWAAVTTIATGFPEMIELKRPRVEKPG